MSLYLNRIKIPGYRQKVTARLTVAGEDMSGQGSHTPQADTGDKPKEIGVTTQIKFSEEKDLTRIVTLAEGRDGVGERTVYNILNRTANAMGVRQVVFQGSVDVREDENLQLWTVSFDLVEYGSTAEKKQARLQKPAVAVQTPTGTPVSPSTLPAPAALEASLQLANKILNR